MLTKPQTVKIAILGRPRLTANYERFLLENSFSPIVTLNPGEAASCQGLLLPGGGDITPAFFGQNNKGSRNIDTELDILQFHALELCMRYKLPVLGICKGMQLINIALGGTIVQDMPEADSHLTPRGDLYHDTRILPGSFLHSLYGEYARVNSAHHQRINKLGRELTIIQKTCEDEYPEAICHQSLPILGLQWHPERLDGNYTNLSGGPVLSWFSACASVSR